MEELRRIPLPLLLSIAIDVVAAIVAAVAPQIGTGDTIGLVIATAQLASPLFASIGLFLLGGCTTGSVRVGAVIAGVASCGALVSVLASRYVRVSDNVIELSLGIYAAIAVGYAWMIAGRSPFVAAAELVVGIAIPWMLWIANIELHVIGVLAALAIQLVIAAMVSPPRVVSSEAISPRRKRARGLAIAAALLFTASLFVPAVRLSNIPFRESASETYSGIQCLVYGWIVIFGWIANPFLLIAVILFAARLPRATLVFCCLAACAAATAPFAFVVWRIDLLRLDVGYWLWLASIVAFSLAAWDRIGEARRLQRAFNRAE